MPFVDLRRHTQVVAIDRGTGCGENLLEIDHDHGILATQRLQHGRRHRHHDRANLRNPHQVVCRTHGGLISGCGPAPSDEQAFSLNGRCSNAPGAPTRAFGRATETSPGDQRTTVPRSSVGGPHTTHQPGADGMTGHDSVCGLLTSGRRQPAYRPGKTMHDRWTVVPGHTRARDAGNRLLPPTLAADRLEEARHHCRRRSGAPHPPRCDDVGRTDVHLAKAPVRIS